MITIEDITVFERPIGIVFDAERNISLHSATQGHRSERAVAGVLSGLIGEGQEVEWEAPLGPLGRLAEAMFLKRYMTEFLRRKNRDLKALLECGSGGRTAFNRPRSEG